MSALIVKDSQGVEWRREGYCSRCGDCCERSFIGDEAPAGPSDACGYCPAFCWTPDGLGGCINRQSDFYIEICLDYPSNPEHALRPNCTYRWEPV